jgi:hypothetical protein
VRRWGLDNGWKEVAVRWEIGEGFPTILPAPPQRAAHEPADGELERGLVLFAVDRNELRPVDVPPTPQEVGQPLEATAFPGERECLVLGVWALNDLDELAVEVTDLQGPDGALIRTTPSWDEHRYWTPGMAQKTVVLPDVAVRDVIYAPLSLWTRVQDRKLFTMMPMWLLPHEPQALAADKVRLFWLTVRVPAGSPPGPYKGTVTVVAGADRRASCPIQLDVQTFALDDSLCSWGPVTATNGFSLALYQQLAEHHMTALSWWWDDWGLAIRRDGDRASFDPRPLDLLNAVTREAGLRGPWIILLGSMTNGQLERRIAASGLFDVRLVQRPGAKPDAPPTVGDLNDREMDRRYVEVLQALARRAREKDYPEIILIVYDEPTSYLLEWHHQRCALIRKHVPELKILSTPQGDPDWAAGLMDDSDYMVVRGYKDTICQMAREAGKGLVGFGRLTADMDFTFARWTMGLRYAEHQPAVLFFWALNYGGLDAEVPFNDLVTPQNWGFRHRFAWPVTENVSLEHSWGHGHRWIETVVWEAQNEGAKDYLLLLMVERELAFSTSSEAEDIRKEWEAFKRDAATSFGSPDARRRCLVEWYRRLTRT